jgi:hypothetical protein
MLQHCNIFTTSVTVDEIDPANPKSALENIEIPETIFGDCYSTQSEALFVATGGAINLDTSATRAEMDQAIRQHNLASSSAMRSGGVVTASSPAIIAIGYDGTNYTASSWNYLDSAGVGCTPSGNQSFAFMDYRVDPGWNNDLESIVAYTNCNSIGVADGINLTGDQFTIANFAASIYEPVTRLDLNDRVSSSLHYG